MAGDFLQGGPVRLLPEAGKVKPKLCWRPQEVEGARVMDSCQEELQQRAGTSSGESIVLRSTKLEEVGDLMTYVAPDMDGQDLQFALLGFSLNLVQYFLSYLVITILQRQ